MKNSEPTSLAGEASSLARLVLQQPAKEYVLPPSRSTESTIRLKFDVRKSCNSDLVITRRLGFQAGSARKPSRLLGLATPVDFTEIKGTAGFASPPLSRQNLTSSG